MLHALMNEAGEIVRVSANIDLKDAYTKAGLRWVPVEENARPQYDPTTQVCEQNETITKNSVVRGWVVRDKTTEEIDAEKTSEVSSVQRLVFEVLFNQENRIRTLEGKASVTAAQFRNALKARI